MQLGPADEDVGRPGIGAVEAHRRAVEPRDVRARGEGDGGGGGRVPGVLASGVDEGSGGDAPSVGNALRQNIPNPFNPETVIRYSVARTGPVAVRIYNVNGALVRALVDRVQPMGEYGARWNGTDDQGRPLPSGAYFYRMESQGFADSRKLILLR